MIQGHKEPLAFWIFYFKPKQEFEANHSSLEQLPQSEIIKRDHLVTICLDSWERMVE